MAMTMDVTSITMLMAWGMGYGEVVIKFVAQKNVKSKHTPIQVLK